MPTPQKEEIISDLTETLKSAQAVVFADYRGLTVAQVSELRKKLRESDTSFAVVKNTLFKRAADGILPSDPDLDATLNGPTAVAFALKDPVATSKVMLDYIAAHRNTPLKVKGAIVGGKFYNAQGVEALSRVPPKDQLVAAILGSLNAPLSGIVGAVDGVLSSFVYTLSAIIEKKQAEA
jgi:large subunit ribosomal protein L10